MGWQRLMLPEVETRRSFEVLSGIDWAVFGAPYVVLVLAGVLAIKQPRDPLGEALRMILLPFGLWAFFVQATFRDFAFRLPEFNPVNYAIGLGSFTSSMKLVEMTFLRRSPKRDGKPASAAEVLSYLGDPRGIHWDVDSKPPRAPARPDVNDRKDFLWQTWRWFVQDLFVADLCQIIFQLSPTTVTSPFGGSIYVDTLPTVQKYALSSLLTLGMGAEVYVCIDAGHQALTLLRVGIFGEEPADYPPIFNQPWAATSVRQLWSRRWQNMYRSYYAPISRPVGELLFGRIGGVLAVFTLTGLLHSVPMWGMGRGLDPWRIVGYFFLQGVAVLLEEGWGRIVGKRVEGIWGRVWAWAWVLTTSHLVVEAWLTRGMAGRPSVMLKLVSRLNHD